MDAKDSQGHEIRTGDPVTTTQPDGTDECWLVLAIEPYTLLVEPDRSVYTEEYLAAFVDRPPVRLLPATVTLDGYRCERCNTLAPDEHFDHDCGLCDDCVDYNASRVVI